ncbi:MAG: DNA polymerase I [Bacteroidales bacterium]|nr:DNA polymerase I [Bacteroidales bacterium]
MKLFLLDGHALIFKMYYAFLGRPMINSKGVDTSILFGFTKYLLELLEREKPTHVAVSFDPPGGTFRNKLYPAYKGTRPPTPQLVIDALDPLVHIVGALGIPVLMIPGFEADDVIGSMAKRSVSEGFDVFMVTPDKDYAQLVEDHIFQYKPGKGGDNEVLGPAQICEKYGISRPSQVIDLLTICGDAADNVPGVKGVGEKGAGKLLMQYGSVEGIYEHLGELTARQQQMFSEAKDHIGLSKTLVTIKTDIPLETTADDMRFDAAYGPEIFELFNLYEFNSLRRHLKASAGASGVPSETCATLGTMRGGTVSSANGGVERSETVSGGSTTCRGVKEVADCAIVLDGDMLYVADRKGVKKGSPEEFRSVLEDERKSKAGFGIKAQMGELSKLGISLRGRLYDCELMHYLLNPERSHKKEALISSYVGIDIEQATEGTGSLFDEIDRPDRSEECKALLPLADRLYAELDASSMKKLYDEIEEPLMAVLSRMELCGVKIDLTSLKDYAESLRHSMLEREKEVRELAGDPALNVSSPKQIGELLFERMKLDPAAKKPKKGSWPTDEETLSALADRSPIIDAILDYRGLRKLLGTYIEPFAGYVSPVDGRVHTTFNQALTSTGRLSSSNPNLQNIPVRTEQGREFRKAFVPDDPASSVMMSADYSQIELRVMAHLSGDEHLCAAFREGRDVHSATASKIFGVPVEEVTPDQRRMAKTANFGIMYGISSFGLAQRLKTSRSEAKSLIDGYFASFPAVRSFIDDTLRNARASKYTETLFGRRRYIPDIDSHNANVRAFAERNAVNAPIQGTAADIIKIAMIRVAACLEEESLKARMVLQIHDELLLEVPNDEIERVREILVREMENVVKLNVPLTVECNYGKTWLDAH